ncbi:phage tail tape measure protein [Eubacterium multiforme]|uniref:TP901 family phage tail tape measure protein n=1 Tax=Eubacterium multiforme TaxID=83339 RepID=A0ABT9US34_9FIRM|nr:phage tail tape measure protein [Eubacterium multiforme]MDQ0149121.1 TP901 family phage tail tape measure protein [Eubacterium multiforme]
MSDEQLLVTLGVQDKGATKQISTLKKELNYLDKEYKATSKGSKDFEKTQEGLKTKLTYLEKKYEIQNSKLKAYNKQLAESKQKVNKKKEELEKLKNAEGDNTKAIEKAEKQLERYQNQMRTATHNISLTEIEMKNLKKDIDNTNNSLKSKALDDYKSKMKNISKSMQDHGDKIKKIGEGITTVGKGMSVASAGIVAAGAAGVVSYKEVKGGLDNVIKATGATGEAAKGLEKTYKNIASNSGDDFGAIGSALGEVNTRFGYVDKKAEDCTKTFLEFARINNTDATSSVQLVSRAMGDAGIKADKYNEILDELTSAAQASGISIDRLTENLTKYGAPMRALGFDTKESIAIFSSWEKAGVNTEIAFSGMKKAISNWSSAGKDSRKEFKKTLDEIAKCPDIASATTKAIKIFGQKAGPDLADAIKGGRFQYEDFLKIIEKSQGTVKNTFNQITDGTEDAAIAMNNAKLASAELGKTIMVAATPLLKELSNQVKSASKWFNSLDDNTKQTIVKVAAFTATLGPATLMLGKLTSGVGGFVKFAGKGVSKLSDFGKGASKVKEGTELAGKGVGLLSKGMGLLNPVTIGVTAAIGALYAGMKVAGAYSNVMNKNILHTREKMTWLERAVADFTGTQTKSKEELIKSGLVYKDFGKNISQEFQKKVEENTRKVNEFNLKLGEINFDKVITKKESEEFKQRVTSMCDGAINAIKSKQEESNKSMKEFFVSDGVLDESEKRVLNFMKKNSDNQINEVNKLKKEIFDIEQRALNEKRGLSDKEVELIKEKNNRIAQVELEALGKTHEEVLYAQNEFQERIRGISLEDASKLMQEKTKIRDEEITKIKASYDTKIALLKENLAQADGEDKKAIQDKITAAENERNEKLKITNGMYADYLKILGEKNPEILAEINKYNGEMLTQQDKSSQKILGTIKSQYDGIDTITSDGTYSMYNKIHGTWSSVSVDIDERTGEILGIYDSFNGAAGGYTKKVADNVKKMGAQHQVSGAEIERALNNMKNVTINASGQMVDSNGRVISTLKDVKRNADGTREGILNLNGRPIHIKANTNGAISNLNEVRSKINNIPGSKRVTIMTVFEAIGNGIKSIFGFAKGTTSAPSGVHVVGEEGFELARRGNSFAVVGVNGPEFRRFRGGEEIIPHNRSVGMLRNVMTSGGYFSSKSFESKSLTKTINTNNQRIITNSNSKQEMKEFADEIIKGFMVALSGLQIEPHIQIGNKEVTDIISNELAIRSRRRR